MSIPGVQCKIRVEDLYNKTIFFEEDKTFASHEAIKDFGKSNYGLASNLVVLVVPIRTNNIKNFASDLLFPLTISMLSAEKIHVVAKAILIVLYTIIDMVSLPVRLVTAIPRALYNHVSYKEPELYTFLKGKPGVNPKTLLKCDYVVMTIIDERKRIYQDGEMEGMSVVTIQRCVHFVDTLSNHVHSNGRSRHDYNRRIKQPKSPIQPTPGAASFNFLPANAGLSSPESELPPLRAPWPPVTEPKWD